MNSYVLTTTFEADYFVPKFCLFPKRNVRAVLAKAAGGPLFDALAHLGLRQRVLASVGAPRLSELVAVAPVPQ